MHKSQRIMLNAQCKIIPFPEKQKIPDNQENLENPENLENQDNTLSSTLITLKDLPLS